MDTDACILITGKSELDSEIKQHQVLREAMGLEAPSSADDAHHERCN